LRHPDIVTDQEDRRAARPRNFPVLDGRPKRRTGGTAMILRAAFSLGLVWLLMPQASGFGAFEDRETRGALIQRLREIQGEIRYSHEGRVAWKQDVTETIAADLWQAARGVLKDAIAHGLAQEFAQHAELQKG
jgi:hypothetical protein